MKLVKALQYCDEEKVQAATGPSSTARSEDSNEKNQAMQE
jgi:ATP-binding cassette subfamily G (WHITE) protein 2 (SNQ2)